MNLKQFTTWGQSQPPVESAAELSNPERFPPLVVEGATLGVPEIDSAAYSAFRSSVGKLALQLPDRLPDDEKLAQIRSVIREFEIYRRSGEDELRNRKAVWRSLVSFLFRELLKSLGIDSSVETADQLLRMVFVDVTETARALGEARRAQQRLENAMASLAEAVVLTDILGVIQSVNRAAEELSGWRASDLIGKTIDELLPTQAFPPGGSAFLDLRAPLGRPCKGTAGLLTRERKEVQVEISTSPILDKQSGSISGVAALLRKI